MIAVFGPNKISKCAGVAASGGGVHHWVQGSVFHCVFFSLIRLSDGRENDLSSSLFREKSKIPITQFYNVCKTLYLPHDKYSFVFIGLVLN